MKNNRLNTKQSKTKRIIGIIVTSLIVQISYGQTLTLDSCKILALQNNVKIKNSKLEITISEEVKKQAFTKYFPNVSALVSGYHALNPIVELGIDDIGNANARNLLNTLYNEYGQALGLDKTLSFFQKGILAGGSLLQPVFIGGQIVNGNRLANIGIEAAKLQSELAQNEVMQQTEESYWLIISLQEKQKTVLEVQTLLDTLYRDVSGAQQAGLTTKNDVLKVTLKKNEINSNLLKIKNGLTLAKMALCQSIGISYSDTLILVDSLETTPQIPLSLYREIEQTVPLRTESKLLNLSVKAENIKQKMIIGEALPQIAIGGGYAYNNLLEKNTFNGLLFASLQIPISAWWETSHKIRQQNLHKQIAENNRKDLTEKMYLQTQQVWNELQESYQQIIIAKDAVENAKENMEVSTQNYRAGLIPVSELLESQAIYRQSIDKLSDELIAYKIKQTNYKQITQQK